MFFHNSKEPTSVLFLQLAQPIRLLLEYTGTKYEDKFFVCGEGNLLVQLTDKQL